ESTIFASLEEILTELNVQLERTDLQIQRLNQQIEAATELTVHLLDNRPIEEEWLASTYWQSIAARSWQPANSNYTSLKESGNLYLISNQELRNELFLYYEFDEYMFGRISRSLEALERLKSSSVRDIYRIPQKSGSVEYSTPNFHVVQPISEFPRHEDFIGDLSNYGANMQLLVPRVEELRARNVALQEILSTELEQR
ncbi:MAG: hypothetical protein RLN96_13615, partial [Pseudomonadales bacterium]